MLASTQLPVFDIYSLIRTDQVWFHGESRAFQDRQKVIECLVMMMKRWPRQILSQDFIVSNIIDMWNSASVHASQNVRAVSKDLKKLLDREFPDRMPAQQEKKPKAVRIPKAEKRPKNPYNLSPTKFKTAQFEIPQIIISGENNKPLALLKNGHRKTPSCDLKTLNLQNGHQSKETIRTPGKDRLNTTEFKKGHARSRSQPKLRINSNVSETPSSQRAASPNSQRRDLTSVSTSKSDQKENEVRHAENAKREALAGLAQANSHMQRSISDVNKSMVQIDYSSRTLPNKSKLGQNLLNKRTNAKFGFIKAQDSNNPSSRMAAPKIKTKRDRAQEYAKNNRSINQSRNQSRHQSRQSETSNEEDASKYVPRKFDFREKPSDYRQKLVTIESGRHFENVIKQASVTGSNLTGETSENSFENGASDSNSRENGNKSYSAMSSARSRIPVQKSKIREYEKRRMSSGNDEDSVEQAKQLRKCLFKIISSNKDPVLVPETELKDALGQINQVQDNPGVQAVCDEILTELVKLMTSDSHSKPIIEHALLSAETICKKIPAFYSNCLSRLVNRIAEISDDCYAKYRQSSSGGRISEDPKDARFDVLKQLSAGLVRNTAWPEAFEIFLPKLEKAFILRMFTERIQEECMIENGEDITSEHWVKKILTRWLECVLTS